MSEKYVYIVLTATGSAFSGVIKTYTRYKYNHASLSLNRDLTEMYSFGRRNPTNPLSAGFIKEDVEKGTYTWFPRTECVIYKLPVSIREYKKIERMLSTFKKNEDKYIYNFAGLFTAALNAPWERNASYFCSQFVAELLKKSGIRLFSKSSSLVKPSDFSSLTELERIYEGPLYKYRHVTKRMNIDFNDKKNFPFTQYFYQRTRLNTLIGVETDESLSFTYDYLRPKKIYLAQKITGLRKMIR